MSIEKDTGDRWPLRERPGFLIRRMHQLHVALFTEACAAFEVTPLQYSLLSALAERGTADQTTLSEAVFLDRTTTTGALKRLATRRLVERAIDSRDRRARACQLTRAGADLLALMDGAVREAHRRTLERLGPAEQKLFVSMMQRMLPDETEGAPGAI